MLISVTELQKMDINSSRAYLIGFPLNLPLLHIKVYEFRCSNSRTSLLTQKYYKNYFFNQFVNKTKV